MKKYILDKVSFDGDVANAKQAASFCIPFYKTYLAEDFPKLTTQEFTSIASCVSLEAAEKKIKSKVLESVQIPAGFSPEKMLDFVEMPGDLEKVLKAWSILSERIRVYRYSSIVRDLIVFRDTIKLSNDQELEYKKRHSYEITEEEEAIILKFEELQKLATELIKSGFFRAKAQGFFGYPDFYNSINWDNNPGKDSENHFSVNRMRFLNITRRNRGKNV